MEMPEASAPAAKADAPAQLTLTDRPAPSAKDSASWRLAGWVTTGALAAGAITCGAFAYQNSQDLKTARQKFPADQPTLNRLSNRVQSLSIVADALTAGAVVIGAITLFSTLGAHGEQHSTQVVLGPSSVGLHMQF
jgi:hypothetical protein